MNNLLSTPRNGHAAMVYTAFFDEIEYLYADNVIDSEIMQAKFWNDTAEDGDRKRRRQAEFLVHQFLPWGLIEEIGVINTIIQTQVKEILQKINIQTPVKVYSEWYY
ncbi:DarT ssDNA thymidine ADP-ribosyltransferase family protein [Nodularia harveyana UHCC-0300]|uniref:DarT ssDNA thymidine ADP-ribosyltransferase family protein n=1 Tax=Nodularia harveyana UHCC-0300 TaxID=2974287 RepID=A0ABU5UJE0_9CYAN|nr:DarT ssDNA thymidine ADP-ribosyltransferase family protein [Nodularia harveyana]MEA5583637.1 DarT ssDNA thymidine ADP-ribosyltransferase family protein [Nodularia harveyana UHCC-0300]